MTNDEIINHIRAQFVTDSGIILGIPRTYHEALFALMQLAIQMTREDERRDQ